MTLSAKNVVITPVIYFKVKNGTFIVLSCKKRQIIFFKRRFLLENKNR